MYVPFVCVLFSLVFISAYAANRAYLFTLIKIMKLELHDIYPFGELCMGTNLKFYPIGRKKTFVMVSFVFIFIAPG